MPYKNVKNDIRELLKSQIAACLTFIRQAYILQGSQHAISVGFLS